MMLQRIQQLAHTDTMSLRTIYTINHTKKQHGTIIMSLV